MNASFLFALSSSYSEEEGAFMNETWLRRQLRDKSSPLSLCNKAFRKRFRLTKEAFIYVLSEIDCQGQLSHAVPPTLQLAATLSLLASGGFQHSVGSDYLLGMCQGTVSKITTNVCKEIEVKLCPKLIIFSPETNSGCKEWFMGKYGIPGVIGCIDGTHIEMQRPTLNEHMFLNRKTYHSLNSMIICDHKYKINAIHSKYGGAAHDSFVWNHSEQRNFLQEEFNRSHLGNAWLLGDSGYPLEPWCITPYRNPEEGSDEANFNDIHSKARCIVERTIGILKGRWKILCYGKRGRYRPEKVAMFRFMQVN